MNNYPIATILGGGGFLGKYLARNMAKKNYRCFITTRNPFQKGYLKTQAPPGAIELLDWNLNNLTKIKEAINNSDIVIASRFLKTSKVNGLSYFRNILSICAKLIFSYSFPHENLKEYTCNFRIYRSYLIRNLISNKNFFKNEDFNIAVKILLSLISSNKNLKIFEYPFILNYHHKIGASKMSVLKNTYLTLKLIILKKF